MTAAKKPLSNRDVRPGEANLEIEFCEKMFQALFDSASFGVVHGAPSTGRLVRVNRKMCEITGYSAEELQAPDFSGLTHPEDRERDSEAWRRLVRGEAPNYQMEKRLVRKDGSEVWVKEDTTIVRGDKGASPHAISIFEDITGRKQAVEALRESEARFHQMFNNLNEGVAVYQAVDDGRDFVIVDINQTGQALSKIRLHETVGQRVSRVFPGLEQIGLLDVYRRVWRTGQPERHPLSLYSDGRIKQWVENFVFKLPSGLVVAVYSDTTGEHNAEQALEESRERHRTILQIAMDGYWLCDMQGRLLEVNKAYCRMSGYTERELLTMRVSDLEASKSTDETAAHIRKIMERGEARFESHHRRKDGSVFDVEVSAQYRSFEGGRFVCFLRDITDRKLTEEALEKRLAALSLPPEDTAGIAFEDLFNLEDIQRLQDEFAQATGVASIITRPDGTPITAPSCFCRLCIDIIRKTEKGCANCFRSDAAIGRVSALGPTIQPCMSGGLWDAGAGITVGGQHIANWLIGQVRDETQTEEKMRAYAREIGADENAVAEAFREVPAMSHKQFEKVAQVLFTLANQISTAAYQNVRQARFITERKRAEEALRESETMLKESQRIAGLGSYVLNTSDGVWKSSDVLDNLFGINETYERTVEGWEALIHPDDRAAMLDYLSDEVLGKGRDFDKEYRIIRHNDKAERWVHGMGKVNFDAQGRPLTMRGTIQDITGRKKVEAEKAKLEEQLQQSQKMESVGRLAGGVAHDFNNMLGVILGHAEMAIGQVDPMEPLHDDLVEIQKAAQRSADLTRQLLAFARKQTIAPRKLDLNETIAGMLKMLQRLIGANIQLVWLPETNLWPVKMDPSQLDQIMANLCVNARDAIAGVGKITIETGNIVLDENYCATHAEIAPGEYARITVSDNGQGMDKETQAHIFEPFFTTKGVGEGTGLGLATVYGAIRQNKGFINVYSEPGQGTVFTLYLPRLVEKPGQAKRLENAAAPVPRGEETILLVEDEPAILIITAKMLERLGYMVLSAHSPEEAIRLAGKHNLNIDLLMTDVIMPEMSGRDLADKLLTLYPHLKRLFISGYTADIISHSGILDKGVHFIQKPFSMKVLAAKIREVLESK